MNRASVIVAVCVFGRLAKIIAIRKLCCAGFILSCRVCDWPMIPPGSVTVQVHLKLSKNVILSFDEQRSVFTRWRYMSLYEEKHS